MQPSGQSTVSVGLRRMTCFLLACLSFLVVVPLPSLGYDVTAAKGLSERDLMPYVAGLLAADLSIVAFTL